MLFSNGTIELGSFARQNSFSINLFKFNLFIPDASAVDGQHQLGVTPVLLELDDTKKFENMLHDKIHELEIELVDSNTAREKEVLVNEINTLKCVLSHLYKLQLGRYKLHGS